MRIQEAYEAHVFAKRAANQRAVTIKNEGYTLRAFIRFALDSGANDLESLTPGILQAYLNDLFANGCKGSTVRSKQGVVMAFLNWCEKHDHGINPRLLRTVDKVRYDSKEPRCLTPEEAAQLVEAAGSGDDHYFPFMPLREAAIIRLMLDTGMRSGELRNLDVFDLDLSERCVYIRVSKTRKCRRVYFGESTEEALRAYLEVRGKRALMSERIEKDRRSDKNPALWLTRDQTRMCDGTLAQVVRRVAKSAGLEGVHIHTLRHTTATLLLRNGMPIHHVQRILGHSTVRMTERYLHLLESDTRDAYAQACPMDMLRKAG